MEKKPLKPEPANKLLTVRELSEMTGWSQSTIRQKVWQRKLEFIRIGGSIRFELATIVRLIDEGRVPVLPSR